MAAWSTSGAMDCAWSVAVLTARSAASVRSTRASGIRKDTSTREPIATTSRMTRSLMAARAELDPDPADRMQVAGLLSGLAELAAQPRDVDVDRLVRAAVRHPPDVGEQVALGTTWPARSAR